MNDEGVHQPFDGHMTTTCSDLPHVEPHSVDAEQSVLGAILLDHASISTARLHVRPEEFYTTAHQTIYRAMVELADEGRPIDNIVLTELLKAKGTLSDVGGSAYLAELIGAVGSASNIGHHARIVSETARTREIRRQLMLAMEAANHGADRGRMALLIDRLKVTASVSQDSPKPRLQTAVLCYDELLRTDIPERASFLPWLTAGSIAMVFGSRGIGKTFFGAGLAAALCTGTQFLKWPVPEAVGVLYVDGEMPLDVLRERFTKLLPIHPTAPLQFLTAEHVYHALRRDLVLTTESMREQIVAILDDNPLIKVLVLDNISCLFSGLDEDKKREWEPVNAWLIRLRHRGITTILMHHSGKGGQQRGTSGREDALDVTIQLDRSADHDPRQGCRFELRFTKARGVHGDAVAPLEVALDPSYRLTYRPLEESKEQAAQKLFEEGVRRPSELAEELGITKGYASKLLRKIKQEMA